MAENERTITTVFKADISNFSASTQELNKYVAQVNSEFRNATASMDKWNNNSEGLRAKLTQLNGILDAEKIKLKQLEDEYNALTDEQKQNTEQGQRLATALNNQSAKVKETERSIDFYTKSLKELEDAGVDTREELDKLNKEMDEQKQASKEIGEKVGEGAATAIAGIGAACVGAMAALSNLVEETKELRTQMGMLETTFEQQGHSVDAAKKTYGDLYAVLGESDQATEASQHLAQMAKSEEELAQMTNTLTGVYATFGNSLPVEGLAEAMNHTAKLGEVQGPLADALEWCGVNVDTFNQELANLTTEEERAAYINETLNGLYGETAEKYKEVNAEVIAANDAQNKYNQAMADIATQVQPAMTSFKLAMVNVLQTVLAKFNEVDIAGLIGKITGAIVKLVDFVLPPLLTVIGWVIDNVDWLVPLLGTLVGVIGAYNAIVAIAKVVQIAWNVAMSANPIGLIVIAIGALIGVIAVLIANFDKVKAVFKSMVNACIDGINELIRGLNKLKVDIPDWVPGIGGGTLGFNIPTIPRLAEGGVVDKATLAMVGEAGREVVMPLENNTQWIDKLAERISAKSGNQNVTYNINNTFEKMETSRIALHKANLETKRIIQGV